jgi:EAL domain-containing protein (putative c-di-GMP-specific phosphodiesterase class I)
MPGAADRLREGAAAVGLDPGRLVVEISERSGAAVAAIVPEVTRLRELGFKVALDDVGAGNSGLEMLRRLTVDFVKIDREVIASALEDRAGRAMLVSIVSFAREIEAFVIAEGIETPEMLALVREAGGGGIPVQGAQGYLVGRPQQVLETGASLPARSDTFSEPERKGSAATSARA